MTDSSTALILFAHGSRLEAANQAVAGLARTLSARAGFPAIAAFLELTDPDLAAAVSQAAAQGAKRVIIVPYFLTLGVHMERDLPEMVGREQARHPGLEIHIARPLDGHPALLDALLDRMREAGRFEPGPDTEARGRRNSAE